MPSDKVSVDLGVGASRMTMPHVKRSHAVCQTGGKRPLTTPYRNVKGRRMQFCFQAKAEPLISIVRRTIEISIDRR
jgi:hypothetical protein